MTRILTPLIVLAVLAPLAQGSWSSFGAWEPDTPHDEAGGWMFVDADHSADTGVGRIYFNAFAVIDGGAAALVMPNVGSVGSRLLPSSNLGYAAVLGVWKDCNLDETIGAAEVGLWSYSRFLLPARSPCSIGSPYLRDDMVQEFIQVAPYAQAGEPGLTIVDESAAIWGDFGRPGVSVHHDCVQLPPPSGTTSRTGSLLRYADCQLGYRGAHAIDAVARFAAREDLMFNDPRHPEESCRNMLNQPIRLWGGPDGCAAPGDPPGLLEKDSGEPAFEVWDCADDAERTEIRDPLAPSDSRGPLGGVSVPALGVDVWLADERGAYHRVPPSREPTATTHGSFYDGARDFESGLAHDCGRANADEIDLRTMVEHDIAANDPSRRKRSSDFVMSFAHDLDGDGLVQRTARGVLQETPAGTPAWGARSWWRSDYVYGPPTFNGVTIGPDLQPVGASYFTFYASISLDALGWMEVAASAHGIYGAEVCGSATTGVVEGWDCDPEHWWNAQLGGTSNPRGRPVGYPYLVRDTDCYDNSALWGAVAASLTVISTDGACP